MYNTNAGNPSSFGGSSNLRPLNRLKDPYADSLLFGNDNNTTSVANTSTSFQASSSLGLSPIKNNQPSSKKPITPSFDRSFETDLHHFPPNSQNNPLAGGNNAANGRRTVLEVNMKGRKQPPLSSSLFADYSGLDFKPNATAPSSSTIHNNNPAITPQSANHRVSSYGGSVTPIGATSVTDDSHHPSNDTNPIRSLHPHLSLSKISPAMDRLETLWSSWIIVYGYDPRVIQLHDILYHFQQYGEILKQYSSQQNWILLKYDSPVEADRATIQPCFFLPNHQTLLAVHRMNSQLAKSLQLHITSDDTIVSSTDSIPSSSSTTATNKSRAGAKSLEELAPFLSPQQKSDVTSNTGLRKRGREQGDSNGSDVTSSIEADIYIKPKRQKSVCERIVDYFWSSQTTSFNASVMR